MKTKRASFNSNKRKVLKLRGSLKNRFDFANQSKFKLNRPKLTGLSNLFSKKYSKKFKKVSLVLLTVFLVTIAVASIYTFTYLQGLNEKLPSPDKVFPEVPVASEIYDRNELENPGTGNRLYRVIDEHYNSDPVDIEKIPPRVWLSFLAAEDESFLEHKGFDPAAILRCGFEYVRHRRAVCGGSTITQQLVKITTEESDVKLERKINELLLSVKVEQANSKLDILQMYLQVAPFAPQVYGIDTASNVYFGKEPEDLTLAEAALLASIIQDPIGLSPTFSQKPDAKELVKERQIYVLGQLEENMNSFNKQVKELYDDPEMDDALTVEMIEEAKNQELAYQPPIITDIKAGHFTNYVIDILQKRNYKNGEEPFTLSELRTKGLRIYTSLDYNVQQIAENYALRAGSDYNYWNVNNSAILTIRPSTGEVIAMVGSKNFNGESEGCDANGQTCKFNPKVNVINSLQSPGSTNKPLGYYIAYKEGKLFPGNILPDVEIEYSDGYKPRNWNNSFNGPHYTVEQALRDSRNIPALQVLELIGVDTYVNTAKEFGYTSYTENYGPSVILGGTSVYPIEHAQGYSVFANGGDFVEINPILKIVDKDGKTIYEANPQRKQIADPQAVWLLNQTLKNYDGFSWDGRELAGKTGTTEENKDAWFVAYSPDFVSVGWVGNNNNDPMDPNNGYPPLVVLPWMKNYMREIGEAPYFAPKTAFSRPGFVYEGGGDCNEDGCLGISRSWLIEGRTPPRDIIKKRVKICTDQRDRIARDIDIAMGRAEDAEFTYYKMPVPQFQGFLDRYLQGANASKPGEYSVNGGPTEYCNIDRSGGANGPFFQLSAPGNNSVVSNTSINVRGSIFTTAGNITAANFYLDNQPIGNVNNFVNFDATFNIAPLNLENGTYIFRASATDTNGKTNSVDIPVVVGSSTNSKFSFTLPPSGLVYGTTIGPSQPTQTITVSFSGAGSLSNVRIFQNKSGGPTVQLGTMNHVGGNTYSYQWGQGIADETAQYSFYVVAATGATGTLQSNTSGNVSVQESP